VQQEIEQQSTLLYNINICCSKQFH